MIDTDTLERNLERQLAWIRAAESRLTLIIPLGTALFGIIAIEIGQVPNDCSLLFLASWISLALVAASLFFATVSVFPRTSGPSGSVLFFGTISALSLAQYTKKIEELDEAAFRADLVNQIHRNAEIASIKYTWIRRSMLSLLASFPFWGYAASALY